MNRSEHLSWIYRVHHSGTAALVSLCLAIAGSSAFVGDCTAQLFAGLEGSTPPTHSTTLEGFPAVTWSSGFAFDVSGAAATPDGLLYLCNGAFTTKLYSSDLDGPPTLLSTLSEDASALAFGRSRLFSYSNYADPKGIYEVDPDTGACTLVLDVHTDTGFRFFALDYNPVDDLFYGYTEYGETGLYSINIDTGEMLKVADRIPASNGQGRGMAIGRNTVYLTATRGDDGIPYFAYDLSRGPGAEWVPFENPYPDFHSTGGSAYIPQPGYDIRLSLEGDCPGRLAIGATGASPGGTVAVLYAFGTGSVRIPKGLCAGVTLGLDRTAKLATTMRADGDGNAMLMRNIPAGVCGGNVVVQLIDVKTCTPSNVVATP